MRELFPNVPEAYENTVKIAERCNVEFEFGKTKLPRFDVPDGKDHIEYFVRNVIRDFIEDMAKIQVKALLIGSNMSFL